MPAGVSFGGDANSVAVDSTDRVYVFSRGPRPMLVFRTDGTPVGGWGDGEFQNPHAVTIDADDNVYLVDSRLGHVVQKRTKNGELLMQIGTFGRPAERHSGRYFNGPTDVAVHPVTRELFVTDGYGNARVHRFSPEGTHILSWGESGRYPGQFSIPHGITFLDADHVIVCDRENFRLQIFTLDGTFVEQWHAFRPLAITRASQDGLFFVAELGPAPSQHGLPNLGNRVIVINTRGETVARIGSTLPAMRPTSSSHHTGSRSIRRAISMSPRYAEHGPLASSVCPFLRARRPASESGGGWTHEPSIAERHGQRQLGCDRPRA